MKIKIEELKQLSQLFLDRLKNNLGEKIIFEDTIHWKINPRDQLNVYEEPNFKLSSLVKDILSLKELISKKRKPNLQDVKNLGQLFMALSEKVENESGLILWKK